MSALPPATAGSSPLTRGKRSGPYPESPGIGLIPAHAGKTLQVSRVEDGPRAHPRSRGENARSCTSCGMVAGSSPLTRGKRGIRMGAPTVGGAHPRSRGENALMTFVAFGVWGSSPLTRGKPPGWSVLPAITGLIPAHAGKT